MFHFFHHFPWMTMVSYQRRLTITFYDIIQVWHSTIVMYDNDIWYHLTRYSNGFLSKPSGNDIKRGPIAMEREREIVIKQKCLIKMMMVRTYMTMACSFFPQPNWPFPWLSKKVAGAVSVQGTSLQVYLGRRPALRITDLLLENIILK
jgi:hypothetical protein